MQDDGRARRCVVFELTNRAGLVPRDTRHGEHALAGAVGQDHRRDVAKAAERDRTAGHLHHRERAAAGMAYPAVRARDRGGTLVRRAIEHRVDRRVGGDRGERTVTEAVAQDAGQRPVRLRHGEDVTALGFTADRPDQPGAAVRIRTGLRPEPGHEHGAMAGNRVQITEVGQPADRAKPDAKRAAG